MNNGFQMFLLAAEELNFSRAAERAFVTQQCLSDHIRRLEESYHVTLFQRRPRLKLTPEGQAMLRYLSRMQALEDSMLNELSDISAGVRGVVNFGVSSTRGYIIVPNVIPPFQEKFSNVDVQVHLDDTRGLEQLLLNGKLDLFLGVDTNPHVLFERIPVAEDPIYLVISDQLLRTHFADSYEERLRTFPEGVDLKLLEDVPFVQGHNYSTTTFAINQFLMKHSIDLKIPIFVSNFDILLELCRTGRYATLSPKFHIRQVLHINQMLPPERRMRVFPIRGMERKMAVEVITHRDTCLLSHTSAFIRMLEEFLHKEGQEIEAYLAEEMSAH